VPYQYVMQVMNALRDSGYLKLGLVGMESRDVK
jgi:biopolymer transport protein ExbD